MLHLFLLAQTEGVRFETCSLEEALKKAETSGKLVFLDAYTSWCIPCKVMLKEVFSTPAAGEYLNSRFVCVKMDTEKGEGKEIAERFQITSYPTFLILRPDGVEQHRVVGGCKLEEFIAKIEPGLNVETAFSTLEVLYAKGELEPDLFETYYNGLKNAGKEKRNKANDIAERMWGSLSEEEKKSVVAWWFYENAELTKFDSPRFQYLKLHADEIKQQVGDSVVNAYVRKMYRPQMGKYIYGRVLDSGKQFDEEEYKQFVQGVCEWNISEQNILLLMCELGKARCQKNVKKMLKVMKEIAPFLEEGENYWLLAPLQTIYGEGNKKALKKALEIVEKAMCRLKNSELLEQMEGYYSMCKGWL